MLGVSSSYILGNLIFSASVGFLVYMIFLQLIVANLPYKVDEKESKEKTKEYGMRVNIVLVKTENGYFNKREIDEFLKELPSREARITFYTFGKANLLALAMDKEKKIFSCAPFEVCRELNIDY